MGDTADSSWGSRELGGFIRREEARKANDSVNSELDSFQVSEADFLGTDSKATKAQQQASELEQAEKAIEAAMRQLVASIVNHTLRWLAENARAANETGPNSQ